MPQIEAGNLCILNDQMNAEALAAKKCSLYEQQLLDPNLRQLAAQLAEHHRNRFNSLNTYLTSQQ
nr:hypothetical protein [bacterium]